MTPTCAGRGSSRLARLAVALLLGAGLAAGIAVAVASPAAAEPSPTPRPGQSTSSSPGIPDTGSRPNPSGTVTIPSTDPTGSPHPTPSSGSNPSAPPVTSGDDDPAWYDIPGQIRNAINDFFAWMIESSLTPVMDTLGTTVLSTPDLTNNPQVTAIWTTSLIVANAVFVLFVVLGGFVVTSRETLQTRHGLKEILPRLVIGGGAANLSLVLIREILTAVNALTAAIAGQGIDGPAAATAITQALIGTVTSGGFLMTLLVLAALVMAIIVVFTFVLRVACMILLVGVAPLALICHSTPQTEGLAYAWWRAFGACLGMQVAQAVIMLATIRVVLTPNSGAVLGLPVTGDGFLGVLVCLTMLWVQIKLPGWLKQVVLGPLGQSKGRGLLGQLITTVLTIKTLGTAAGILSGAKAAAGGVAGTATRRTPSPPRAAPGRPSRPGPSRTGSPSRPRPSPAGTRRATFSHAPTVHKPLAQPAGTATAPTFSDTAQPAGAGAPMGAVPPVVFSAAPRTAPEPSTGLPSSTRDGHPVTVPAPARGTSSNRPTPNPNGAPAVVFSSAPKPQTAPQRPPAPAAPTFSAAAATSPGTRPTAAQRSPTRASRRTGAT